MNCVGSVGVLMRFVWRSLGAGMGVLGWGWVGVLEKYSSIGDSSIRLI